MEYVPDHYRTHGKCDKAGSEDSSSLQYVSDWFETPHGMGYELFDNGYVVTTWCNDYKERKARKVQMKEELLMSIACIPQESKIDG